VVTDHEDKLEPQTVPTRRLKAPTTNVILNQPADAPVTKASVKKLARLGSPKAMNKLVELAGHDNPFVAKSASEKVLDWAWGKPAQNLAIKGEVQHNGLTVALTDLAALLHRDGLISKPPEKLPEPDVIEAEFVVADDSTEAVPSSTEVIGG
jgi:hypothetical protein